MIEIVESPAVCSLSKNAITFKVKSLNSLDSVAIYPTLKLKFEKGFKFGCYLSFDFINTETYELENVFFRTVTNPTLEGDLLSYEIDTTAGSVNLNTYTDSLVSNLKNHKILNSFYNIVKIAPGEIDIVAKEPISDLIIQSLSENISATDWFFINFTYQNFEAYNKPSEREGYRLIGTVFYRNNENESFEIISNRLITLDDNGEGLIDISKIIDGKIESDFDEIELPFDENSFVKNWYFKPKNLKHYFVQFAETWYQQTEELKLNSDVFFCHWGGISLEDEIIDQPINHILTFNSFLTSIKSKKIHYENQVDFLHFMNGNSSADYYVHVNVVTNQRSINTRIINPFGIELKPFETLSFYSNINFYLENPSYLFNPITLVSGEEIRNYTFKIVTRNIETGILDQAVFIAEYGFTYKKNCATKTILYFNSFGLPETFVTTSKWDEIVNTKTDLAAQTINQNYSPIRSKNFVFNSKSEVIFQAETNLLTRDYANRLAPMLNSLYSFVYENGAWIPVIFLTKEFLKWQNSEYVSILELELIKAYPVNRFSYFRKQPKIIYYKDDFSDVFKLQLNGLEIDSIGQLKIFKNLNNSSSSATSLVKTLTHSNLIFTTNVDQTNWTTNGLPEGHYLYELSITDASAQTYLIKGSFTVVYEKIEFLVEDNLSPYLALIPHSSGNSYVSVNLSMQDALPFTKNLFTSVKINDLLSWNIEGIHKVTVKAPSFSDIKEFRNVENLTDDPGDGAKIVDLKIQSLKYIEFLRLFDLEIETLFLNTFTDLNELVVKYSTIDKIDFSYLKNLEVFKLENVEISSEQLENMIKVFWDFRKSYKNNSLTIELKDMPNPLTDESLAMINGTGIYSSDGLDDNSITVNII